MPSTIGAGASGDAASRHRSDQPSTLRRSTARDVVVGARHPVAPCSASGRTPTTRPTVGRSDGGVPPTRRSRRRRHRHPRRARHERPEDLAAGQARRAAPHASSATASPHSTSTSSTYSGTKTAAASSTTARRPSPLAHCRHRARPHRHLRPRRHDRTPRPPGDQSVDHRCVGRLRPTADLWYATVTRGLPPTVGRRQRTDRALGRSARPTVHRGGRPDAGALGCPTTCSS